MKVEHLLHCQYHEWYPRFKALALKSVLIPLCEEFVDYLNADGIYLPASSTIAHRPGTVEEIDGDHGELAPTFDTLESEIGKAIEDFDGEVVPKLNWSCPQDALWISETNSLKCTTPAEIFLLLKSSDFIAHDLSQAISECEDADAYPAKRPPQFVLALRKGYDLNTSMEFRCFVDHGRLVAVSQRDLSARYPHLEEDEEKILALLEGLSDKICAIGFPDPSYVFDAYISKHGKAYLVDFNSWAPVTDSLLYEWDEVLQLVQEAKPARPRAQEREEEREEDREVYYSFADIDYRILDKNGPKRAPTSIYNMVPRDVLELSMAGADCDAAALVQQLQDIQMGQRSDSDSDSDTDTDDDDIGLGDKVQR